jgi:hypothetical protein
MPGTTVANYRILEPIRGRGIGVVCRAARLRLVSSILTEISEEWENERLHLRMENTGLITQQE